MWLRIDENKAKEVGVVKENYWNIKCKNEVEGWRDMDTNNNILKKWG